MEIADTGVMEGSFMDFTIPTEFARRALYYMPQYGHFLCNGAYDIRRETLDGLLLVCIRASALYFESGGGCCAAPKGSVVLLDCRSPHRYYCKNEAVFLWLHFARNSADAYAKHPCEPFCKVFPEAQMDAMFQHIFARARSIPCNEHLISADIHRLPGRLASPEGDAAGAAPVMPALKHIQSHFREPVGLDELAARCNMSTSHFIRSFQKYLGRTPHEYLLAFRLLKSKQMLLSAELSIEQIAEECGFVLPILHALSAKATASAPLSSGRCNFYAPVLIE